MRSKERVTQRSVGRVSHRRHANRTTTHRCPDSYRNQKNQCNH